MDEQDLKDIKTVVIALLQHIRQRYGDIYYFSWDEVEELKKIESRLLGNTKEE